MMCGAPPIYQNTDTVIGLLNTFFMTLYEREEDTRDLIAL